MTRAQQLRLDAGLSVVALASKAGVAHATVRRIERGDEVQAAKLAAVAKALGDVPASSLLGPAIPYTPEDVAA